MITILTVHGRPYPVVMAMYSSGLEMAMLDITILVEGGGNGITEFYFVIIESKKFVLGSFRNTYQV